MPESKKEVAETLKKNTQERIAFLELMTSTVETETGLSIGNISRWGNSMPSADKILALANYLDVSTDWLFGREKQTNSPDIPSTDNPIIEQAVSTKLEWENINESKSVPESLECYMNEIDALETVCYFCKTKKEHYLALVLIYDNEYSVKLHLMLMWSKYAKPYLAVEDSPELDALLAAAAEDAVFEKYSEARGRQLALGEVCL